MSEATCKEPDCCDCLRKRLTEQGKELLRLKRQLASVRVDLKWMEKEELEEKDMTAIRTRVKRIIDEIDFDVVIGEWHVCLENEHSFCLTIRQAKDAEGNPWTHFEWYGGAIYGWGVKDPNYARDLQSTIRRLAHRLDNMSENEVRAAIQAHTSEFEDGTVDVRPAQ